MSVLASSVEDQVEWLWATNPSVRYAFVDKTACLEAHRQLADSLAASDDDAITRMVGMRNEAMLAGSLRLKLVRRPLSTQTQQRVIERSGNRLVVWVYGPISVAANAIKGDEIAKALHEHADADAAVFRISSTGGDVAAVRQMQVAMEVFGKRTVSIIDHYAMSAAGLLALSCDHVVMRANSILMLHRISTTTTGNVDAMTETASKLRVDDAAIVRQLCQLRPKVSADDMRAIVNAGRYIGAAEALALGLIDRIAPPLMNSDELIEPFKPKEMEE